MKTILQPLEASIRAPKLLVALAGMAFLTIRITSGQVGNDNPTGVAGQFNGNITTGCSYDPYTGNATRAITDIVVAGTVGEYALAFSRVSNSRGGGSGAFGAGGSWSHSYEWRLISPEQSTNPNFQPSEYPVSFPDGREETFRHSSSDTYFRVAPGVRDRFIALNLTTKLAYLLLPDGGKVRFKGTRHSETSFTPDEPIDFPPPEWESGFYREESDSRPVPIGTITWWSYTYQAEAIIDPYGIETNLLYNSDGTLSCIVNVPGSNPNDPCGPGSRSIHLYYGTGNEVIDYIQASDGRTVEYNYDQETFGGNTHTCLRSVVYYPDPSVPTPPTAYYSYQASNVLVNGEPLLSTANDPMYSGPMKQILYVYATGQNGDGTAPVNGQIRYEKSISGISVSNLQLTVSGGRSEVKGDGGTRYFTFNTGRLAGWTDFIEPFRFSNQHYDSTTGYIDYITDRNVNTTTIIADPQTGIVGSVTYPVTPGDTDPGTPAGTVIRRYTATCGEDPNNCDTIKRYYLYSSKDEAGNTTFYLRDINKRVRQINYPDGAYEEFQYNDKGQTTYHRLKTGGWEFFDYDPTTHLLMSYRDPYHDPINHTGKPTRRYQYSSRGWVSAVTDWRGNAPGDPNYTTEYEYNLRGQVTLVRHPVDTTVNPPTRYTVVRAYNPDGTLQTQTNEASHTTQYTYDDYKRLISVTTPPAYANDPLPRTTYFYYDRNGGTSTDYTHTDASVGNMITPRGNTVKTFYDFNVHKRTVVAGIGSEAGTTTYTYDWVGNLKTVKDPLGQSSGAYTEYFYDERNRLSAANDPISADRNDLGYTVNWTYDYGGRRKAEKRANNQVVTYDTFDQMNRLKQQSVQRDSGIVDITLKTYDLDGSVLAFQDGRGKIYYYGHDLMSRPTSILYPPDDTGATRQESTHYDLANNMDTLTDREGAVQTLEYDNRNRQTHFSWNIWPLYTMHEGWMSYDERSNLRHVRVGAPTGPADTTDLEYDWRNREKSETQTNAGRPSRTVTYTYDADSNRRTMTYPSGYALTYDYDSRNQLWKQSDASGAVATYTYDGSGNRRTRTLRNGTATTYTPDALNRPKDVAHYRGGTLLGRFDYRYDTVSRVKSVKRDFDKGDFYEYYLDDQLKTVQFDAYNVDLDSPWGAANVTTLVYDANGNRTSQTNTTTPNNGYAVNSLNQYTGVNGIAPDYNATGDLYYYNGVTYTYDRQNTFHAAKSASNWLIFYRDGLNRQILRYEGDPNLNGNWIYSVWDGWDLIEEYDINGALIHSYVHGATTDELISRSDSQPSSNRIWYYQDAQGSTSHIASDAGTVVESYKYPPTNSGAPVIYNGSGQVSPTSGVNNRFLYTGREYYKDAGIYDYRNRAYSPSLGRFLQPDPIGFAGDATNVYRYCGNNAPNRSDPFGLQAGDLFIPSDPGATRWYTGYMGSPYQQQISPYNTGVMQYNHSVVPAYNGAIDILSSSQFRFTLGGAQIWIGGQTAAGGFVLSRYGAGAIVASEGLQLIESGLLDMQEAWGGQGLQGGEKLKPMDLATPINFNFLSVGQSNVILFGQGTSTGRALYNAGQGWLPIGQASADIRWAPNSGTGNWTADQTAKAILLAGGCLVCNAGEGFHPVSFNLQ